MRHTAHDTRGFVSGLLFGGVVGALLGVFLAPRSGEETRYILQEKGTVIRDQARENLDRARASADDWRQRGQEFVTENKERIERTASAVQQAAREAWTEADQRRGASAEA